MKIKYIISLWFSVVLIITNAQVAINSNLENESKEIKVNFSGSSLKAYQESSKSKIKDFYQYLGWISNKEISQELKNQAKESIYSLYENKEVLFIDFISPDLDEISLEQLITKIQKSEIDKFIVESIENSPEEIFSDYWISKYILKVKKGKKEEKYLLEQKVFFKPIMKNFGEGQKRIWKIFLGEAELNN